MRYIKIFENIKWDDWEIQEEDDSFPFEIGDVVKNDSHLIFWNSEQFITIPVKIIGEITNVDKSENITSDGSDKIKKGTIPYDGWLFKIKGHWPWFKYDENVILKKIK